MSLTINGIELDEVTLGYLECALWTTLDDEGEGLDETYSVIDMADDALTKAKRDCDAFAEKWKEVWSGAGMDDGHAGHNLWLTRNGHGSGFWDIGLDGVGDSLTEGAQAMGSATLYVGDDGKVHYGDG